MRTKKVFNIFSPVSPTDTYMIYDQYHIGWKNHLHVPVKGKEAALERYNSYKVLYPGFSLGLCTIEYYNHLMQSYKEIGEPTGNGTFGDGSRLNDKARVKDVSCESLFHIKGQHGKAMYIVTTTYYPNGKKGKKVRRTSQYMCEKCVEELMKRRRKNEILDKVNDFEIRKI